jgi:hypothetical protein
MKVLSITLLVIWVFVATYSIFSISDRVTAIEKQRPPCSHILTDTTIYVSCGKSDTMVVKMILH